MAALFRQTNSSLLLNLVGSCPALQRLSLKRMQDGDLYSSRGWGEHGA